MKRHARPIFRLLAIVLAVVCAIAWPCSYFRQTYAGYSKSLSPPFSGGYAVYIFAIKSVQGSICCINIFTISDEIGWLLGNQTIDSNTDQGIHRSFAGFDAGHVDNRDDLIPSDKWVVAIPWWLPTSLAVLGLWLTRRRNPMKGSNTAFPVQIYPKELRPR
jgi:hypothetical protein